MCRFTYLMHVFAGSRDRCWTCMLDNRRLNQTGWILSRVWMGFDWEHSFGCSPSNWSTVTSVRSNLLWSQPLIYGDCTAFPNYKSIACHHSNRELRLFITPSLAMVTGSIRVRTVCLPALVSTCLKDKQHISQLYKMEFHIINKCRITTISWLQMNQSLIRTNGCTGISYRNQFKCSPRQRTCTPSDSWCVLIFKWRHNVVFKAQSIV